MLQTILDESIAVETKSRFLSGLVATEYQPKRPMRTPENRNTKTTRGLEKLHLLHSMHYEHPEFTAQNVFDDYGRGKIWTANQIFGHTFFGSERAVHWQIFFTGRGVPKARVCLIRHLRKYNIYVAHTVKFGTNRTAHWKKTYPSTFWQRILGRATSWPTFRKLAISKAIRAGDCFSKVPIIYGPVKLLLFTCKIEVSIVLHLT